MAEQELETPPGFVHVWVPEAEIPSGLPWEVVAPEDARPCRYAEGGHVTCGRPSVARLSRGRVQAQWWHYCERHLYGRLIRGKVLMTRILVRAGEEPGE